MLPFVVTCHRGHLSFAFSTRGAVENRSQRLDPVKRYERARIRAITQTAGVSPGLLRHHCGSKEALRKACYLGTNPTCIGPRKVPPNAQSNDRVRGLNVLRCSSAQVPWITHVIAPWEQVVPGLSDGSIPSVHAGDLMDVSHHPIYERWS
jgi:hypothetical protein